MKFRDIFYKKIKSGEWKWNKPLVSVKLIGHDGKQNSTHCGVPEVMLKAFGDKEVLFYGLTSIEIRK